MAPAIKSVIRLSGTIPVIIACSRVRLQYYKKEIDQLKEIMQ